MTSRSRAGIPRTHSARCSWSSGSILLTRPGGRPMTSQIRTSMNTIDRFYTPDPVAFATAYLDYLQSVVRRLDTAEIGRFVGTLLDARSRGATIFFIGNGGSAATASHF